ncbi:MAG: hypothetical protein ACI4T2_03485 [Christensenellales bacterium]
MKKQKVSFEDKMDDIIEEEIEYAKTVDLSTDGKAIIEVEVNSADEFFSPYCVRGDEVMNPALNDFIMESENNIPLNKKLKVNIYVNEDDRKNFSKIKRTFRLNYADKIATCDWWLKRNLMKSLIFLFIGIGLLAIYAVSCIFNLHLIIQCVCEVVSWVFLWEGVQQLTIEHSAKRLERKRLLRLLNSEISVRKKAY